MSLDPGPLIEIGFVLDAGSGLLFLLLGLAVLFVKPRRRVNTAFGVFAVFFGLAFLLGNLPYFRGKDIEAYAFFALVPLAIAGLVVVAHEFPGPLPPAGGRWQRRTMGLAAAATVATVVVAGRKPVYGLAEPVSLLTGMAYVGLFAVGFGSLLVLLALRFGASSSSARERTLCVLATAAFLPYFALASGIYGVMWTAEQRGAPPEFFMPASLVMVPMLLAVVGLWLRNAYRTSGPDARHARNVALAGAGFGAAGATFAVLFGHANHPHDLGPLGLARGFGVALLAYAIVKHQLLGIDVKLRVAIKGSTLAAIFIGVFFVVSEAAQQFFGKQYNNQYLGIAAAGGLVFAMAPLQRLAERIALKAVPDAGAGSAFALGPAAFYRRQVETAWMDGAMTRREGLMLAQVREHLGLGEAEARRIEAQVMGHSKPRRGR